MKAFVKFNSQQILRYFGHRISKPAKGFQNVLLFRDTYICVRKTEYGFKDFLVSQIVDHVSFTKVNLEKFKRNYAAVWCRVLHLWRRG